MKNEMFKLKQGTISSNCALFYRLLTVESILLQKANLRIKECIYSSSIHFLYRSDLD